ncbi:cob(I)yrinic acid a,c-diamide adenosyltransferase [Pseudomonas sp. C27(2019)]|uniref:cob(I)yrinic acid a,c-diamide adenosyltransferase n=1 Tax=Pseudomonas sp. C27(2019) TaxID=2604941 RepID=UPI00124409BB|nr:cob(I)yrinic acid a,c-diamide adenosyltransferase [Pseudomonas sp. C27(2019)]QEY59593.1 cob(I)yrinic acid a,c-diamide adenosyltransferase [Pseudomonas sp. C27(2019)]
MGYRLSKIYTRTGDDGQTSLADGRRVNKSHPRIEAIGALDEFNSQLGLLLADLQEQQKKVTQLQEVIDVLTPCQHRIFDMGGELSMPDYQALHVSEITRIEQAIDQWNVLLGPLKEFILPGGSHLIAQAHVCRSSARNAERRCQALHSSEALRPEMLGYINRLSDLLFVAARLIAQYQDCAEIHWQAAEKPL